MLNSGLLQYSLSALDIGAFRKQHWQGHPIGYYNTFTVNVWK